MRGGSGPAWPETLVGLGVVALAGLVGVDTALAPPAPGYAQVGPTAFPYGVAVALAGLGALLVAQGMRGSWRDPDAERELGRANRRGLAWVAGGLAVNAALIGWLGFVLASTALFACVARGFASPRPGRDIALGFALALAAYLGFAKLLAISLGEGLIERLI